MPQNLALAEEAIMETMNIQEIVRMTDWLKAKGISDADIIDCIRYIATGIDLPKK